MDILEYFNKHIYHDERVWQRYEAHLDSLDDEVVFIELRDTILDDRSEFYDMKENKPCGSTKEQVIKYIMDRLENS